MSVKPLGIMGPHNDAMCVVMCGTCWFCIWSRVHVSLGWGSHLVRKVSHWYDVSFLLDFSSSFPFLFLFSVCRVLIIKKLNVQCCTTCPKH